MLGDRAYLGILMLDPISAKSLYGKSEGYVFSDSLRR